MPWHTTTDPERFTAGAGPFLRERPVENTVHLTVVEALRAQGGDPADPAARLLGWWTDAAGGAATGAFLLTPPHPVLLTSMPDDAVPPLADLLPETGRPVAGVNASAPIADAFAALWSARTGAAAVPFRGMRLHRLESLVPPDPMPAGHAVTATAAHRPLLIDWYEAFARDIGEPATGVARQVDDRLTHGGLLLWAVGGEPLSLAGITRQVAGATRVAPVYTPPEQRGRGYGAAVTAAVTRAALDAGAEEVLLYTDLANPTSNRLYARLGFVAVEDRVVLMFEA
jgi:predicted GNAT family acetyltransferase